MEESRSALTTNALAFERQLLSLDEMDDSLAGFEDSFLEGSQYRLQLISDENNDFETLKRSKRIPPLSMTIRPIWVPNFASTPVFLRV